MLENVSMNDKLTFADLSEEEKQKRGILGRLYGPCADIIHSTRNGRKYSDKLWEKVFQQPLVEEMFKNGGVPGELDHPADRSETCSEKIAIMMPEPPKKDSKGRLIGYWDIIDTPNGRIAYSLAKYGFKLGISSRGDGDVVEDYVTGEQKVDPDTYTFQAFDLVLVPSVEQARLSLITESLDPQKSKLRESLSEALQEASEPDRKVMEDTLRNLHIELPPNPNIKKNMAADDVGADVIKNLQESLKRIKSLQAQVKCLQEKLSVCYAKEAKLTESLQRVQDSSKSIEQQSEEDSRAIQSLSEQLEQKSATIEKQARQIKMLTQKCSQQDEKQKTLNESISQESARVAKLTEQLRQERKTSSEQSAQITSLKESLEEVRQDSRIKSKEYERKLNKATGLTEHYKKVARTAVDKYIESKAKLMGINSTEIKKKLGENYSFNDIDRICESLSKFQLNMGSLPFDFNSGKNVKVSIKESSEPILPKTGFDDEIDPQLMFLARK